ncbi:hypothetical protein RSAG8_07566, partial [Rhizoctonia solani AG-8 WAC10335]
MIPSKSTYQQYHKCPPSTSSLTAFRPARTLSIQRIALTITRAFMYQPRAGPDSERCGQVPQAGIADIVFSCTWAAVGRAAGSRFQQLTISCHILLLRSSFPSRSMGRVGSVPLTTVMSTLMSFRHSGNSVIGLTRNV